MPIGETTALRGQSLPNLDSCLRRNEIRRVLSRAPSRRDLLSRREDLKGWRDAGVTRVMPGFSLGNLVRKPACQTSRGVTRQRNVAWTRVRAKLISERWATQSTNTFRLETEAAAVVLNEMSDDSFLANSNGNRRILRAFCPEPATTFSSSRSVPVLSPD